MMNALTQVSAVEQREQMLSRYHDVRNLSKRLCETLTAEDCCIQSMPDASPIRWHLAHTTWFFETFILAKDPEYQSPCPQYAYLFNSYYNTLGDQFPRAQRGVLSRPSLQEIWEYRKVVDRTIDLAIAKLPQHQWCDIASLVELGLNHEQQHQELMVTDIKHVFSLNPLYPVYREAAHGNLDRITGHETPSLDLMWMILDEGVYDVGHDGAGFAYDNESPRHRVFLEPYQIAKRLSTAGEYLNFINDGGYERPELWLSEGWDTVKRLGIKSPLYWTHQGGKWNEFTLAGMRPLALDCPVCHVSYFEADAFARWSGHRLPTEFEWEVAAAMSGKASAHGGFLDELLDSGQAIHPRRVYDPSLPQSMLGDTWQWTSSSYGPYPGFKPSAGALGEYNGKFMCNQYVLRGGSCATVSNHIRRTYRNFFSAASRWQFSGVRLACDR
jgi:ergothioneine biosynthesis protein EgtB